MKFEVELTKIEKREPLPAWSGEGLASGETWVAVVRAGGFEARRTSSDKGCSFSWAHEDLEHKISEAALAGKTIVRDGDPRCGCASIMSEDRTRHFKGCAMREVYPDGPTPTGPDSEPWKCTAGLVTCGTRMGTGPIWFCETCLAKQVFGEQAHDTEPPADPRVGEIHGDDRCSETVGGAHDWQPASSRPHQLLCDHDAERMNLAVWLQCSRCSCWAEYADGYPRDEPDTHFDPESIRPPEVTC